MKQNFTLFLFFVIATAHAQEERVSITVNAIASIPQKNFRELYKESLAGMGGRLQVLYNSPKTPIHFGPEIGHQVMDYNEETFYRNGNLDTVNIAATGKITTVLMNVRLQPSHLDFPINPFVDALFGTNVFYTTERRVTHTYFGKTKRKNTTTTNWATCYGASAGLDISVNNKSAGILELRASYLVGDKTQYLTDSNIHHDGSISYKNNSSYTSMIVAQVGLKWKF